MPVELRKRKAPEPAPAPVESKKKSKASTAATKVEKAAEKVKEAVAPKEKATAKANGSAAASSSKAAAKSGSIDVGSIIDVDTFGGEVLTNDGETTSVKKLLDESKSGIVLFTYPKASTGGCTKQVCFFRDEYTPLTSTGLSIYGLSRDSTTANTNFKTKQKLPYPLLCDKEGTLVGAIGFKKDKSATRGVIVISKEGKILAREAGGPEATMQVVKKLVAEENPGNGGTSVEDVEKATVAADVADTAEKIDGANGDKMDENKKEDEEKAAVAGEVADTAETLGDK